MLAHALAFSAVRGGTVTASSVSRAGAAGPPPGRQGFWYLYNQHRLKKKQNIKQYTYKFIRRTPTEATTWHDTYLRQQVQGYERLVMGKKAWNQVRKAEIEEQYALKGDQDADGVDDVNWVSGTVTKFTSEGVQVLLDDKLSVGLIPMDELSLDPFPVVHDVTPMGSAVKAEHITTKDGTPILSLKRPMLRHIWRRMHDYRRKHMVTQGIITKALLTGIVVRFWGFHCFIPKNEYQGYLGKEAVGKVINFRFRYVHWNEQRIIGSHRAALLTVHQDEFKMGAVVPVEVERVFPHGVVGATRYGIPVFLPIAEVSHFQTTDLTRIFKEGQVIHAMVLEPNLAKGDIILSTKYLEPNPGDILTNPQMVFEKAPELAHVLIPPVLRELERRKQEQAAFRAVRRSSFGR
jgi:small subunit ribosomal protein S1